MFGLSPDTKETEASAWPAASAAAWPAASSDSISPADRISREAASSTMVVLPPAKGAIYATLDRSKRASKMQRCIKDLAKAFGWIKMHKCRDKAYIQFFDKATDKWELLVNCNEPHSHEMIDLLRDKILSDGQGRLTKQAVMDMRPALLAGIAGEQKPKAVLKRPAASARCASRTVLPKAAIVEGSSEAQSPGATSHEESPWYSEKSDSD